MPGHFLLFHLVKDALLASASPSFNSRVISVASAAHRRGQINFDDLNFEDTEYTPLRAYDQSKLANILFANELDRRYKSQNLRALSLHPGGILTPLAKYLPTTKDILDDSRMLKNTAQGAATTVWGAVAKEWEGKGGIYLDEVAEGWLTPPDAHYYDGGYAVQAFDPPHGEETLEYKLEAHGFERVIMHSAPRPKQAVGAHLLSWPSQPSLCGYSARNNCLQRRGNRPLPN